MSDSHGHSQGETCSFDEFKLYYESAEMVTERRLSANRWNYSILVAILVAIAAVLTWSRRDATFFLLGALAVIVISMLACIFCILWLQQIQDWKALNQAKFKILNDMAPLLSMDGMGGKSSVRSFRPFEKEWESLIVSENVARIRHSRSPMTALKSSTLELFLPRAFEWIFIGIIVLSSISVIIQWDNVPHTLAPVEFTKAPPITPAPTLNQPKS